MNDFIFKPYKDGVLLVRGSSGKIYFNWYQARVMHDVLSKCLRETPQPLSRDAALPPEWFLKYSDAKVKKLLGGDKTPQCFGKCAPGCNFSRSCPVAEACKWKSGVF